MISFDHTSPKARGFWTSDQAGSELCIHVLVSPVCRFLSLVAVALLTLSCLPALFSADMCVWANKSQKAVGLCVSSHGRKKDRRLVTKRCSSDAVHVLFFEFRSRLRCILLVPSSFISSVRNFDSPMSHAISGSKQIDMHGSDLQLSSPLKVLPELLKPW